MLRELYKEFEIDEEIFLYGEEILDTLKIRFEKLDQIAEYNQFS